MGTRVRLVVALLIAVGIHAIAIAGTFQQGTTTRTYDRGGLIVRTDGNIGLRVNIKNANGRIVDFFDVVIPVSGAVTDGDGNQLSASVPAGISSARSSLLSAIDAAIDSAAAAGKFAR